MAARFKSHKGFRFGVRGSLFAAFAVIAGMAIVISAGAGLMLGRLGGTMVDLSGRDIPRLAASLQLSAQSASLASQGPALLAARSEEALNDRTRKMKETQAVALQKLGEIVELGADKAVVAALTENMKNIDDVIKSLGSAARERLELGRPARKALRRGAQGAAAFHGRRRPCGDRRADRTLQHLRRAQLLAGRRHQGPQDGRPARRHRRQRQSHGVRHDRRAFDQQRRYARSHRQGIPHRAGAREVECRSAAQDHGDDGPFKAQP